MKVASVWIGRRHWGSGQSLACMRCSLLFPSATEFVKHSCFAQMRAGAEFFNLESRLKHARPAPAGFNTLVGVQSSLQFGNE
jgi:hypothetical protein